MKPFDLKKALSGDKLVTREGNEVVAFHYFENSGAYYPIAAIIKYHMSGSGEYLTETLSYDINGREYDTRQSENDLFMSPNMKTYYVDVYKLDNHIGLGLAYDDPSKKQSSDKAYVKTIEFELDMN